MTSGTSTITAHAILYSSGSDQKPPIKAAISGPWVRTTNPTASTNSTTATPTNFPIGTT